MKLTEVEMRDVIGERCRETRGRTEGWTEKKRERFLVNSYGPLSITVSLHRAELSPLRKRREGVYICLSLSLSLSGDDLSST